MLTPQTGMHKRTGHFDQAASSHSQEPWLCGKLPSQASDTDNPADDRLEDDKGQL